eukprot:TRINITY_DN688_c0_g2_i1.p1 TRINITY_DN688_c0_g2~~TRINITY_DN688_c0_g2_i1.p1  ORF type:complete len:641 (-),score=140.75 TRINITY_DN688_c0_g2_i1:104-2026(-)
MTTSAFQMDFDNQEAICVCGEITLLSPGQTPLHIACSLGHHKCLQHLITTEYTQSPSFNLTNDINQLDQDGESPLHEAVHMNSGDCIRILAQAGADLESTNSSGLSPLFAAFRQSQQKAFQALLDLGADVNCTNLTSKLTPLHVAASRNDLEAATLLLAHGANSLLKSKNGQTALDLATGFGHQEIIQLLSRHPSTPSSSDAMSSIDDRIPETAKDEATTQPISSGEQNPRQNDFPESASTGIHPSEVDSPDSQSVDGVKHHQSDENNLDATQDEDGWVGVDGSDHTSSTQPSETANKEEKTGNFHINTDHRSDRNSDDEGDQEEEDDFDVGSLDSIPSLDTFQTDSDENGNLGDSGSGKLRSHDSPVFVPLEVTENAFAKSPPLYDGSLLRGAQSPSVGRGLQTGDRRRRNSLTDDSTSSPNPHSPRADSDSDFGADQHSRVRSSTITITGTMGSDYRRRNVRHHSADTVNHDIWKVNNNNGGGRSRAQSETDNVYQQDLNDIKTSSNSSNGLQPTFQRVNRRVKSTSDANSRHRDSLDIQQIKSQFGPPEPLEITKWMADEDASHCCGCSAEFGWVLVRRHHCRFCGKVFCSNCSSNYWNYWSNEKQEQQQLRVCTHCVKILEKRKEDVELDVFSVFG